MKTDLAVIGQGAVSPAGLGLDALLHGTPTSMSVAEVAQPEKNWPVLRIDLKQPAFARWLKEPRLRRASSITHFLIEAADQALANLPLEERAETGLIVAFSAGCLVYSRRFFETIITQGQRAASPALFPETVFNSPVSHVASVLQLNGAAYALVSDETAIVTALKTASIWLRQGRVKNVLILGAEEFDPLILNAYASARWLRRQNSTHGFLTSEGAAALLVRAPQPEDTFLITHLRDGFIYRTKKEAHIAAENLFRDTDPTLPVYLTAQRNIHAALEKSVTKNRLQLPTQSLPYLGEAFTASTVWHTLRALSCLDQNQPRLLLPIWGLNHQLASIELAITR